MSINIITISRENGGIIGQTSKARSKLPLTSSLIPSQHLIELIGIARKSAHVIV